MTSLLKFAEYIINPKQAIMPLILNLLLAVLLLLCLADMPYGYYTLVRYVSAFVFAYYAYVCFKAERVGLAFTFGALALLFQPFYKIVLGRTVWNVVDVVVAAGLLYLKKKALHKCLQNQQ